MKDPERLVVDIDGVQLNSALKSLDGKVGDDDPISRPPVPASSTRPRCGWCWI